MFCSVKIVPGLDGKCFISCILLNLNIISFCKKSVKCFRGEKHFHKHLQNVQ